jgi:hypothetical protein
MSSGVGSGVGPASAGVAAAGVGGVVDGLHVHVHHPSLGAVGGYHHHHQEGSSEASANKANKRPRKVENDGVEL